MRVSERLSLVDRIGRLLQERYTFAELHHYLAAFGVPAQAVTVNSKWAHTKNALAGAPPHIIAQIAHDLDLGTVGAINADARPPANWKGTTDFKLFISHISKDRTIATRLKACLAPYAIAGFVAHEDIHPTLEWQVEIERGLITMDAMVAVHTPGFSQSYWTQQEVGFALGRGVKVISFKMGEDPTGFISKRQALSRQGRTAEQIAKEIDALLRADPLTAPRIEAAAAALDAAPTRDDEFPF